ncbi:MAG: hypothetical protein ABR550_07925 [Wenzhouxiangellaceae bacterium]
MTDKVDWRAGWKLIAAWTLAGAGFDALFGYGAAARVKWWLA